MNALCPGLLPPTSPCLLAEVTVLLKGRGRGSIDESVGEWAALIKNKDAHMPSDKKAIKKK